jgi:galactokinase
MAENNITTLISSHQTTYGLSGPEYVACSPGRVNIIGEHIDYSDFAVLPMAIEHSSMVAFSIRFEKTTEEANSIVFGRTLRFANRDEARFPSSIVCIDAHTPELKQTFGVHFNRQQRHWYQYFLAGYVGVLASYEVAMRDVITEAQMKTILFGKKEEHWDILVDGSVPIGSGLSSSSALVCASAVAVCLL